jgi:hypothetical protein
MVDVEPESGSTNIKTYQMHENHSAAKAGDIIWYFKTDDKKKANVSIKPEDIGITKYKQMPMATVKDALEIMGYGTSQRIEPEVFGIFKKSKKTNNKPCHHTCEGWHLAYLQ